MDMTAMTAVAGVVVAVIVCTVLAIIAKFGFRERDYDDVYGQQERLPATTSKKALKKKKPKAKGGTQSDLFASDDEGKAVSTQVEELPDDKGARSSAVEHLHVEYDPDPVIIDEPQSDSKSKVKQAPKKSILRNRSDSLKEAEATAAAAATVQTAADTVKRRGSGSFSRIPKDEVELKHHPESKRRHSTTAKAAAPVPGQIASSTVATTSSNEPQPEEVVEVIHAAKYEAVQQAPSLTGVTSVVSQPTATKQPSPPPATDVPRKEKSKNSKQARTTEVSALATAIQNAVLSKADVQELVDLLLGKGESAAASWTTKAQRGDPVAQLTKQLEDKDRQLVEERQQVAAAAAKMSKLEKSLQEERARHVQVEQQAADRIAALDADLTALKQRMQHTHDQHVRDLAASSRQQQGAAADTQELAATITRLKQENQQLKEAMPSPSEMKALKDQAQIVKNELAKSIQNLTHAEAARSQADSRCRRLEEQMASKEKLLCQQLDGVKQELQRSELLRQDQTAAVVRAERTVAEALQGKQEAEHRAVQLSIDLRQANAGTDLTVMEKNKEIQTLKQQLAVAESKLRMIDSGSQSAAAAEVEHYKAKLLQSQAEIDRMQAVVCEVQQQQRSASIAVVSQQPAGSDDGGQQLSEAAARWAVEAESLARAKQQLEQELHQLRDQLRQNDSGLQAELGEAKRRNDELRRKNWSLVEALASAESLGSQAPELRQQLDGARASLDTAMTRAQHLEERNTELTESLRKQIAAVSAASAELESMRAKLNDVAGCEHKLKSDAEKSHAEISRLKSQCEQVRDEADRQRHAAVGECSDLRQQLHSKEFEIYSLQADLEMHQQAAEAFRAKYEKAEKVDHTHVTTDGTTVDALHQLKAYKDEVTRLKEQLAAQAVSGASLELAKRSGRQADVANGDPGATDLLKQLDAQKAKNNELREKNWKLMEALKEAEKQQSRDQVSAAAAHPANDAPTAAASSPTGISLSEFKAVVARLYPSLRIDSLLGDSAWLANFESAVRKHNEKSEEAGNAPFLVPGRELLLEADRMLDALQQKLDKENKAWQHEASLKDREIAELRRQLQPSKVTP